MWAIHANLFRAFKDNPENNGPRFIERKLEHARKQAGQLAKLDSWAGWSNSESPKKTIALTSLPYPFLYRQSMMYVIVIEESLEK